MGGMGRCVGWGGEMGGVGRWVGWGGEMGGERGDVWDGERGV